MDLEVAASYVRQCNLASKGLKLSQTNLLAIERPIKVKFSNDSTSEVSNLSTSLKVTIFPPTVPHYFITDQCLKGDL